MGRYNKPNHDSGDRFDRNQYRDQVLLFDVHDYGHMKTQYSKDEKAFVKVDILVITGPDRLKKFMGVLLFNQVLVDNLRESVGGQVLGRLGKKGRAFVLEDPTDNDEAEAERVEDEYKNSGPEEPDGYDDDEPDDGDPWD